MRNRQLIVLSLLSLFLVSCAYIGDSNKIAVPHDKNSNQPPLRTPPDMSITYKTNYPIPNRIYSSEVKTVNITPPGLPRNTGSTS